VNKRPPSYSVCYEGFANLPVAKKEYADEVSALDRLIEILRLPVAVRVWIEGPDQTDLTDTLLSCFPKKKERIAEVILLKKSEVAVGKKRLDV
jgi:hypothetical protein